MPSDDLFAALESALRADADNVDLRSDLANLYLTEQRFTEALRHAEVVLAATPDHLPCLQVAAEAAEATGDVKAAGYRRLADALGEPTSPPPSAPSPTNAAAAVPDSADELLEMWDDEPAPTEVEIGDIGRVNITLADVGGMDEVKARLTTSFLAPMRNPEMQAAFGKSLRGGLLLWGPPGCGKTFIAKACAGELGAKFYSVGLSDVLDMWIGSSERNLSSIFDVARRNAPCVLFFDEMDALGQKRTQLRGGGGAMRGVVNQFLSELDGATSDNDGVFVLGATNHPWDIDAALVRPGRFDRRMLVLPPDVEAREAILRFHLRGKPQDRLDLDGVAKRTDGYSGADLALLCDSAAERAMTDSIASGKVRTISMRDMKAATKEVKTSTGPWFETARNYALYSNDSGQFDDLLAYLKRR